MMDRNMFSQYSRNLTPLESVYLNACPPYPDYVINPRILLPCPIYYAQHGTTAAVDAKRLNTIWQSVINSILMFAFVAHEKKAAGMRYGRCCLQYPCLPTMIIIIITIIIAKMNFKQIDHPQYVSLMLSTGIN